MKYLSVQDLIYINQAVVNASGGSIGVRDMGLIDSAVNRPQATFVATQVPRLIFWW